MPRFRTALVTGASSGIGAEVARVLAARGCGVTLVARRRDRLTALADELATSVDVDVVPADLATDDGVGAVQDRLRERPVELLVNDAAAATGGRFYRLPIEPELHEIRVNVVAVVRLTHAALQPMVKAGHGAVLNVSSLASDQPLRGNATYAGTKSFVTTFSESLAADLRGTGVTVTVVKPGFTFTALNEGSAPAPDSFLGRHVWLQPHDVATAAVHAVEQGRLICVPGAPWKAVHGIVRLVPRGVVRTVSTRLR